MSRQAKSVAKVLAGEMGRSEARAIAGKGAARLIARAGAKGAAKTITRTASSPWLLVADGVDLAVTRVARRRGASESDARTYGKRAGLAASVGIGAAVGGPVGAVVGLGAWGVGELVDAFWD